MKPVSIMITGLALGLGVLGAAVAIASGFGYRLQWWHYETGFKMLAGGVIAAGVATALAAVGIAVAWRGGDRLAVYYGLGAIAVGLLTVVPPLVQYRMVRQLPYIHDITTDTENPPAFVAILKERAHAPNTAEYGGPEIARQQKQAYPDIQPVRLAMPPDRAFVRALAAARRLGWRIVAEDPAAGRIEASDRTFWYGFIDDVVIRITPDGGGARVDVRSVSRVGKSDVGANARRIRAFVRELTPPETVSSGY